MSLLGGEGVLFVFWRLVVAIGLFVSSLAALSYGAIDIVHHYLLRAILALSTDVPFNIAQVLDKAVRMTLLRRVGSGYVFLHRTVLDCFVEQSFKTSV